MGDLIRQGQPQSLTSSGAPGNLGQLLFPFLLSGLFGGGGQGGGIAFGTPAINTGVSSQGSGAAPLGGVSAPTTGGTPQPGTGLRGISPDDLLRLFMGVGARSAGQIGGGLL